MGNKKAKRAYLVLADGTVFHGYSMGAAGETVGEVVFNTCTASYQSLLSDPTYYGQIVAQTYPLVGNRGVEEENAASNIMANGYIAREWYDTPCTGDGSLTLDEYLRRRNIVGICGIDTRRLTRALRDKGYFNGAITDSLQDFDALLAPDQGIYHLRRGRGCYDPGAGKDPGGKSALPSHGDRLWIPPLCAQSTHAQGMRTHVGAGLYRGAGNPCRQAGWRYFFRRPWRPG